MSTYFFSAVQKIQERCSTGLLLMLDFDGTLVPIMANPADCWLSDDVKALLRRIAGERNKTVCIVSGRSLPDVKKRVGIKGICYSGSHGLEISGPAMKFVHPEAKQAMRDIEKLRRLVEREFGSTPGIVIESKPFSLAFHYRMLPEKNVKPAVDIFRRLITEGRSKHGVSILRGKKVLEVIPEVNWSKGAAVNYIKDRTGGRVCPVYVGDDRTDESAFTALGREGITVRVGRKKNTAASHHLQNQKEIIPFLELFSR